MSYVLSTTDMDHIQGLGQDHNGMAVQESRIHPENGLQSFILTVARHNMADPLVIYAAGACITSVIRRPRTLTSIIQTMDPPSRL